MEFHQVVVSAAPGDAVTNSALALRSLLRRIGPSEIFALNIAHELAEDVVPLSFYNRFHAPLARTSADNVIIFHGSIGSPEVFSFIHSRPERIVLLYHNVSPAEAFLPYDPAFAGLLESGRKDIAELRDRIVLAIAPSRYNADELVAMGYPDVRITPLIVETKTLAAAPVDPNTASRLAEDDDPLILYVGQLLPHKRPDFLLAAYHVLTTYLVPEARLALVGTGRLHNYRGLIESFRRELNLHRVEITGAVSDDVRNAYYHRANLLATASEHEGFCVPLLEAMSFRIPIVARSYGAISETLAGAGVELPAGSGPVLFAEALAEVISNASLRATLTANAEARLRHFDPDTARADFLEHLLSVA